MILIPIVLLHFHPLMLTMDIYINNTYNLPSFLSDIRRSMPMEESLIVLTPAWNPIVNLRRRIKVEARRGLLLKLFNLLKNGGIYISMDIRHLIAGSIFKMRPNL